MVGEISGEFRQLALEEIASDKGYYSQDIETLGRLLALRNHPDIKELRLKSPSTSQLHYEALLKRNMEPEEVKQILVDQGLKFGRYSDGVPFYDLVSEKGNKTFYLNVE